MRTCAFTNCNHEQTWTMQPFGPEETACFTLPGAHYRGFATLAICDEHKELVQGASDVAGSFTYKGTLYTVIDGLSWEAPF